MLRNKFKELLERENTNPCQLGPKLGISKQQMYKLLKDPSKIPSGIILNALCSYYDKPPSEFIEFTSNR